MDIHPYGCEVMHKMFENCTMNVLKPILDEIIPNCIKLTEDQLGN